MYFDGTSNFFSVLSVSSVVTFNVIIFMPMYA